MCKNIKKLRQADRYCGEDLPCIGVERGDSFSTSLRKINEAVCAMTNLSFEENELCENGGLIVRDGGGTILYATCYPCCGSEPTPPFKETYPLNNGTGKVAGEYGVDPVYKTLRERGGTQFNDVSFEIPYDGVYRIRHTEFYGEEGSNPSAMYLGVGVNGNTPVFDPSEEMDSNTTIYVSWTTPTYTFTKDFLLNLNQGDVIKFYYKIEVGNIIVLPGGNGSVMIEKL